ncbi:MAG TPA: hypothetical protein PLS28_04750, partial [Clostridiales bacterium]|nr:hypothetical protein [Clostridiales bacterium]
AEIAMQGEAEAGFQETYPAENLGAEEAYSAETPADISFAKQADWQDAEKDEEKVTKHPKANRVARQIISALFVLLLLFALLSVFFSLFGSKWTDAAPFGFRYASVAKEYKGAGLDTNKVVKVETEDFSSVRVNDIVLSKTGNGKVYGRVLAVTTNGVTPALTVQDDTSTYMVTEETYVGIAKKSINGLGALVRYASNHTFNFYGFQLSFGLLLIGILLLLPVPKKRIKTKDIDQAAFTI